MLDPTKLIPEEIIPLRMVGKMVLNRVPDNHFAETEQVAFCPANIVPGLDFTSDPLLQGRLFSYLDTQLSRLGGPNFHQIPVNAPKCPFHNVQRDGMQQMLVPKGRVNYEPNSLDASAPRENPAKGFTSFPEVVTGEILRKRSETFADHYSQARLFFRSMTEPEQRHMVSALAFELAKVETMPVRTRVLGHLAIIDSSLHRQVEEAMGMEGKADKVQPAVAPRDLAPSPALSLIKKAHVTLKGRKVGVLITDGFDPNLLAGLRSGVKAEKAQLDVIAPKIGGAEDLAGQMTKADHSLSGAPSIFFDAVVILADEEQAEKLSTQAQPLLDRAGVQTDQGIISLGDKKSVSAFIKAAKEGHVWDREPKLRSPG